MKKLSKYIPDKLKNKKGVALIIVAGVLIALFALAALAIDIAYMYLVKNELQVAADAAALAGAAKLTNPDDLVQADARAEAILFAGKNKAAGSSVVIANNNSNDLSTTNDITVGNWNGERYTANTKPVNAIQVRARRTENSPGGPVSIFLGRVFGWNVMSASAEAIAAKTSPFIGPFPICLPSCQINTPLNGQWEYDKNEDHPILCTDDSQNPPGQFFYFGPSAQANDIPRPGLAWSNFDQVYDSCPNECDRPNPKNLLPYINGQKQPPVLCSRDSNKYICTTNGSLANIQKELQDMFNQRKNDYKFKVGTTEITISGWLIIVPVVSNETCGKSKQTCPGAQENTTNPYKVERYARVLITEVDPPKGLRFVGFDNPRVFTTEVQCKKGKKTINRLITSIGCTDCSSGLPDSDLRPKLVK